jgi:hypothetical protein
LSRVLLPREVLDRSPALVAAMLKCLANYQK